MARPHALLAYDAKGNIIATLDHMVARDAEGNPTGLIDFAAHEVAGGEHTDIWQVRQESPDADGGTTVVPAKGSKVWPEWLGGHAHDFRVELAGPKGARHIAALVHKTSGHRRVRKDIEAAIAAVVPDANGVRDIRHLVGGPTKSLVLDEHGRTSGPDHVKAPTGTPTHLPLIVP